MLNSDTPAETVESAYFAAVCSLDVISNQLSTVISLARLASQAQGLDEPVADSFRAIANLVAFNCDYINAECAQFERLGKALRSDNVVGIVAGK